MKDFSLYGFSPNDKILSDAEYIYNMQLESLEGKDVTIDGIPCKVLIYNHLNELNELKEERIISCKINIPFKRGSLVGFENGFYITTSLPDNHMVYWKAKIQKTNNTVTFKCIDSNTYVLPCIKQSATLYSDGIQEGKTISYLDDEVQVLVPYNLQTCKFKVGQRFIFDKEDIYKITSFDKSSYMENINGNLEGVLKIHMARTEKRATDDLENNLADNSGIIEVNPTPIPTGNLIIQGKDELVLGRQTMYEVVYDDGTPMTLSFVWSLEGDITLANVINSTTATCELKANSSKTGYIKLVATYLNLRLEKNIYVRRLM